MNNDLNLSFQNSTESPIDFPREPSPNPRDSPLHLTINSINSTMDEITILKSITPIVEENKTIQVAVQIFNNKITRR